MRYKVTCLTPTLVGDGRKLSPIDYMVWKDQVNVLDQPRIIKLLSKGPRLDGYLAQVRKAEKLDFASWGGFAQNFADRRIPFEHPSLTPIWDKQRGDTLFIPTFASGTHGAYLPGSALRGVLHTAVLFSRWNEHTLRAVVERCQGERLPRRPGEAAEEAAIGMEGQSRMRSFAVSDSTPLSGGSLKVYLVRTATLVQRGPKMELGWKQIPRGSVEQKRIEDSTPAFCEMAGEGAVFEGGWIARNYLSQPDVARPLRWKEILDVPAISGAANALAAKLLGIHRQYASAAGLTAVGRSIDSLERQLADIKDSPNSCLLNLGWGGGFLSKAAFLDTENEDFRKTLRLFPFFSRALQTGLAFPKTRKVVFLGGQPAALPGWVRLDISG